MAPRARTEIPVNGNDFPSDAVVLTRSSETNVG